MPSANTSSQYKICGYRLNYAWLEAWGKAQATVLTNAIVGCGIQAHKVGILPIGPEDTDGRDLCVYVATNSDPEDETLPDEDTMIKMKTLLEREMDEEPQWYESTTAIRHGN
ncbi:hypothetical protein DFH11DRAFT_1545181 [Phellopilus nigrolimitatus]|nr:hypothetical protein DFH11DRAFT_1545181 [Phellopilus nigrolimitatus]